MEKPSQPAIARCLAVAGVLVLCSCHRQPSEVQGRVSYGRQIAPIFAFHCNGCHGRSAPSSQFQAATYTGLRAGGVLGEDIVPGAPEQSMLVKFIEGFRGPDQRMPLNAAPLTRNQIGLIRRWIKEGALNDHEAMPCYKLRLSARRPVPEHSLLIQSKVSGVADLLLSIRDSSDRSLYSEEASVKQPSEQMDAGAPGQLLTWTVNYQKDWPARIRVELWVRYMTEPLEVFLSAQDGNGSKWITKETIESQCLSD